jgi:PPOX class probable F420-dependent enzyme
MRLKKAESQLLQLERVCRVATADRSGAPHLTPVCQVVADGTIYFAIGRDSRKFANVRRNPRLAVLADIYTEDWPRLVGALIEGRATLIERGPRFRKIRKLLYVKYPQYPEESAVEEGESVIVEITPERATSWGTD